MYQNDKKTLKEYQEFWKTFDVEPLEEETAKALIEKYSHKAAKPEKPVDEKRKELVDLYKRVCKTFNSNMTEQLDFLSKSEIMGRIMVIIDNVINERYSKDIKKVKDPLAKGYFIDCLAGLYDQEVYNISEEDIEAFTKCGQDKISYQTVYLNCGGDPSLFPLNSPFYDLAAFGEGLDPYESEYNENMDISDYYGDNEEEDDGYAGEYEEENEEGDD